MEKISFEEAMKRLEEIIKLLEGNQTSLENSLSLFQEGMELTQLCTEKLQSVENKVSKIMVDNTVNTNPTKE